MDEYQLTQYSNKIRNIFEEVAQNSNVMQNNRYYFTYKTHTSTPGWNPPWAAIVIEVILMQGHRQAGENGRQTKLQSFSFVSPNVEQIPENEFWFVLCPYLYESNLSWPLLGYMKNLSKYINECLFDGDFKNFHSRPRTPRVIGGWGKGFMFP